MIMVYGVEYTMIIILVLFAILYVAGIAVARKKSDSDKCMLPKVIKQILFLGTYNKYRLGIIIYQSTLIIATTVTFVFGPFYHIVNVAYLVFSLFMFLVLGIYSIFLGFIEHSRHKDEYREYSKVLRSIVKAEIKRDEAELTALRNRAAQLRDYLYNKNVERSGMPR